MKYVMYVLSFDSPLGLIFCLPAFKDAIQVLVYSDRRAMEALRDASATMFASILTDVMGIPWTCQDGLWLTV